MTKYVIDTKDTKYETEAAYYTIENGILTFYDHGFMADDADEVVAIYNMDHVIAIFPNEELEDEE